MSRVQVNLKTGKAKGVHATPKPEAGRKTSTTLFECLVASPSVARGALFEEAAIEQGWDPIVCNDAEDATRTAVCRRIRLALVDLESAGPVQNDAFRSVVEQVAAAQGPLLLICGSDGDVAEEIWARQLGAWMYVPGIDSDSDLPLLFGEAKSASEKLLPLPPAESPLRGEPESAARKPR
jgi:hypothetical protein